MTKTTYTKEHRKKLVLTKNGGQYLPTILIIKHECDLKSCDPLCENHKFVGERYTEQQADDLIIKLEEKYK